MHKEVRAMSEESCRKRLWDEGTCPVCRDYFTDPVTLDCGHNFCSTCINRVREFSSGRPECPLCRGKVQTKKLKPNTQLANMLEVAQDLSNLLKHRGVCSVEEAEKEFAKDQISRALEILRKGRKDILGFTAKSQKNLQDLLRGMETEKERTAAAFRQLHEFLDEHEKHVLAQREELKEEVVRRWLEHMIFLSGEVSYLDKLNKEVEEKRKQSSNEFLQISGEILERCKKMKYSEKGFMFPFSLMWRLHNCSDITCFLEGIMNQFKGSLVSGLQIKEANVSLDPDKAHPMLIVSEDCKSVRWKNEYQDLSNNPEEFKDAPCVLGHAGFIAGRYFWDVAVSNEEEWSVGIAVIFENGKDEDAEKVLRMKRLNGEYFLSDEESETPVNPWQEVKKIRVTVNYAGGLVGFLDADTGEVLGVLETNAPYERVHLLPCFNVSRRGHLTLCAAHDNEQS